MNEPIRIGIIGLGNFGQLHAATVVDLREAQLVALVDHQPAALERMRKQIPGVRCWTNTEQAIAESDADAWIVASSTASHIQVAANVLKQQRSVLLEKPIATSYSEAETLNPLVRSDSQNLMLGHVVLFNSEFRRLQFEVQQRGTVNYISCARHRPASVIDHYPGESPFHLTMVHDLYCVLTLMNACEPSAFQAHAHRDRAGNCDLAIAHLQWPGGAVASFVASFLTPPGMPDDGFDRLEVFGDGWAARMQPNPRPFQVWDDRARWPMALDIQTLPNSSGMLAEELRTFCRVVRNEQPVPLGARYIDGLQVLNWLDRLQETIR